MFKLNCGARVRDLVTGFKGIVTARSEFLNGCRRYGVTSEQLHEGKPVGAEWFDEEQLAVDGEPLSLQQRETGGPRGDAPPLQKGAP